MKKLFLLATFCWLFSNVSLAQSNMGPKAHKSQVINSAMLYEAIGYVDIPVYLTYSRDVTLKYCWYKTTMQWGNYVRTSEEPIRTQQGAYVNGRLSTYQKGIYLYQISWSSDGEITSIHKYQENGSYSKSYYPYSFGLYWTNNESLSKTGRRSNTITISHVFLTDRSIGDNYITLAGYCISSGWLCKKIVQEDFMKVKGQIAKKWVDHSRTDQLRKINPDGSFSSNDCFDVCNNAKCAYYEL